MRRFIPCLLVLGLAACQSSTSRYAWGAYDASVLAITNGEGTEDLGAQVEGFERAIEVARTSDSLIPPGLHAHLGMLYALRGSLDLAQAAFESERELYPESAVLMDRLIGNLGGAQEAGS